MTKWRLHYLQTKHKSCLFMYLNLVLFVAAYSLKFYSLWYLYFYLAGILNLLQCIGRAIQALSQFECKKAIETFQELPLHQYNTGFVRSKIGRAYFELADYSQVIVYYLIVNHNANVHVTFNFNWYYGYIFDLIYWSWKFYQ